MVGAGLVAELLVGVSSLAEAEEHQTKDQADKYQEADHESGNLTAAEGTFLPDSLG